jgi:hypothetical protein
LDHHRLKVMPIAMAFKARSDLNGGRFNSKALCKPMSKQ